MVVSLQIFINTYWLRLFVKEENLRATASWRRFLTLIPEQMFSFSSFMFQRKDPKKCKEYSRKGN